MCRIGHVVANRSSALGAHAFIPNLVHFNFGTPRHVPDDSNFGTLLGHHLRKRSEKEGTGAVHEKNTKVCRNLVPKWEATGRDNEILGTILGARRAGKGPKTVGWEIITEAAHEKNTKVCRNLVPKWKPRAVIIGLPFDT